MNWARVAGAVGLGALVAPPHPARASPATTSAAHPDPRLLMLVIVDLLRKPAAQP
jgi:hypothetical protein